jgi:hypothetical protein
VTAPMHNEAQRVFSVAAAGLQRGDSVAGTWHNVASGRNLQKKCPQRGGQRGGTTWRPQRDSVTVAYMRIMLTDTNCPTVYLHIIYHTAIDVHDTPHSISRKSIH